MTLKCALSGDPVEFPVVSPSSGLVFEKRLILKYLSQNGNFDPSNSEPLSQEMLVPLVIDCHTSKCNNTILKSVPTILRFLQEEWDSLLLQQFELKKQLEQANKQIHSMTDEHEKSINKITSLQSQLTLAQKEIETLRLVPETVKSLQTKNKLTSPCNELDILYDDDVMDSKLLKPNRMNYEQMQLSQPSISMATSGYTADILGTLEKGSQISRRLASSVADFSSDMMLIENNLSFLNASRQFVSSDYVNLPSPSINKRKKSDMFHFEKIKNPNLLGSLQIPNGKVPSERNSTSIQNDLNSSQNSKRSQASSKSALSESQQNGLYQVPSTAKSRSSRCYSIYSNMSEISNPSSVSTTYANQAEVEAMRASENARHNFEYENLHFKSHELSESQSINELDLQSSKFYIPKSSLIERKDNQENIPMIRSEPVTPAKGTSSKLLDPTVHAKIDKTSSGRISSWSVDLDILIHDPIGVNVFTEFLRKEFSEENILFWIACEKYKTLENEEDLRRESKKICEKFLSPKASMMVNIDAGARIKTEKLLQNPTKSLFFSAQEQIFNLMKYDSYKRFLESEIYKKCLECEKTNSSLPIELINGVPKPDVVKSNRRKSLIPWSKPKPR